MGNRKVTERDFRKPEFISAEPEDYEFRGDGKIVRKDRWEYGIRRIAGFITDDAREFEIENLVKSVEWLLGEVPDIEILRCICGAEVTEDEGGECKSCGEPVCHACQAKYNQFTQIDFSCHQSCADDPS